MTCIDNPLIANTMQNFRIIHLLVTEIWLQNKIISDGQTEGNGLMH